MLSSAIMLPLCLEFWAHGSEFLWDKGSKAFPARRLGALGDRERWFHRRVQAEALAAAQDNGSIVLELGRLVVLIRAGHRLRGRHQTLVRIPHA